MNTSENRKVILYIACSLDGFIAAQNDDLSFLSIVEKQDEDYGYNDFINSVDTVIMGRKTYDKVLTLVEQFPHADKKCFIITKTEKQAENNIIFYNQDLTQLIEKLKAENGKNIFVDGGAEIVNELIRLRLIDEFYISIIPCILGNGTRLFKEQNPYRDLELLSAKSFETGLVQLHYQSKFKQ